MCRWCWGRRRRSKPGRAGGCKAMGALGRLRTTRARSPPTGRGWRSLRTWRAVNPRASQTVQLTIGDITVISNVFYKVKPPSMVADRALGIGLSGTTNTTYRIEYRPSLGSGQWLALRTNTLRPGFNQVLPWPPTNGPAGFYRAVWLP